MVDGEARTVVVTGAAGRAGRALALGLAARGDRVVAADRDVAGARETVALIEADGGAALAVGVDVTVLNSARALALTAADFSSERGGGGRIDVVIHAASDAGTGSVPFTEVDVDEWDRLMAVNLKGPWLVTRACSRFLPPGGKVVILCAAAAGGSARAVHSAAAEGGTIALARALAEELRGRGVAVNAVVPGSVVPGSVVTGAVVPGSVVPGSVVTGSVVPGSVVTGAVVPGSGEPDDIVGAALFLAGPGSARITGQALVVDEGRPFG